MDLLSYAGLRSPRRPYFSLLVQRKVGKRNTPRRSARRERRVRSHDGNFRTGHPALAENGAHPCAPPLRGFTRRDCRTSEAPRTASAVAHAFGVPMRHGEWVGSNPQRAAPDGRRFRMARGCALRGSRPARGPGAQCRACRQGCVSLVPFFAQAKKCFSTAVWLVTARSRGRRYHAWPSTDPFGRIQSDCTFAVSVSTGCCTLRDCF